MNSTQTCVKETFACDEYFQLFLLCLPVKATLHCFAASWSKPWGVGEGGCREAAPSTPATGGNYRLEHFITNSTFYSLFGSGGNCRNYQSNTTNNGCTSGDAAARWGREGGVGRYRLAVLADLTNGHYGLPSAQEVTFNSVREQEEEAERKGWGQVGGAKQKRSGTDGHTSD